MNQKPSDCVMYASEFDGIVQTLHTDGIRVRATLPIVLTEDHWRRFDLTRQDVYDILKRFDKPNRSILFRVGLLYGIVPTSTGMKAPYGDAKGMMFEARANIVRAILDKCPWLKEGASKLDQESPGTTPLVDVPTHVFHAITSSIPNPNETWDPTDITHYKHTWTHKNATFVPIKREDTKVLMHRIVDSTVYDQAHPDTQYVAKATTSTFKTACILAEACYIVHA